MTSYLRYKQQIRTVLDADDDIESWITVRGNHIPIKKGQSKEEAVKSFISSKKKNLVDNHNRLIEATKLEKQGYFGKETPSHSKAITKSAIEMGKEEKNLEELMEFGVKEANKYDPEFETVRKNALANSSVYGGKYTQKSKAEAYKEYKNDTSSKENMKKANEFVNGTLIDKRNLPAGTKWSPTDIYGNGTGNTKEEKEKILKEWSKKGNEVVNEVISEANTTKQSDWMSKKPNIDLEKLRNGDIKEMDKYFKWGTTGNSDWFEEQKKKDFGSKESEYKAYNLYDKNRKNRSQTNKNYLDDEIGEGLIEISYNDMQFSNNAEKNRSNLIKAIKESKHDKSKQMVDIVSNMPDKMLSNLPSFLKALEAATEGKAKSLKKSSMDSWKRLWGKK